MPSLAAGAGSGLLVAGFTHFQWSFKTAAVTGKCDVIGLDEA